MLQELAPSQSHKIKSRQDLESEFFSDISSTNGGFRIRDNEGEAAEHGIYYDDTEYDYMQHIRDLSFGNGDSESFFVESKLGKKAKKGKEKISLEEALREASLQEGRTEGRLSKTESLLDEDMLPSRDLKKTSYQDHQDIPDDLAGFQPDMDPRLREVLEALDDEAYVDDEEDFFTEITQGGEEVNQKTLDDAELPESAEDDDDDDWESDNTEKPSKEFPDDDAITTSSSATDLPMSDSLPPDYDGGDWMKEFSKFKNSQETAPVAKVKSPKHQIPADVQSSLQTGATSLASNRRKKRKGAMTNSTGYSMTSSSLARTEGLELLDARFDKIEEEYAADDGEGMELDIDDTASIFSEDSKLSHLSPMSQAPKLSASSQAPELTNASLEDVMDEFLGGYSMSGKKRVKKGGYQSGLEQLDEVRRGLGPARIGTQRVT